MKAKEVTTSAIMLSILIVCSQIALPIGPIPITLQTLAILLIGFLLPPKSTLVVTTLYVLGGLIGLPFFSGFVGGIQSVFLPSFGFIISFIAAAFFQAKYLSLFNNLKSKHYILSGLLNIGVTYLIGLSYMSFIFNVYLGNTISIKTLLLTGLLPFITGDFIKLTSSILIAKRLKNNSKYRLS